MPPRFAHIAEVPTIESAAGCVRVFAGTFQDQRSPAPAAAHQLLRYPWPGNVRELENAMERAVVLTRRSRIDIEDLPPEIGLSVPDAISATDLRPLADVERDYIQSVLRAVGGNRAQAAAKLGIGEATLYRKIKQYGTAAR